MTHTPGTANLSSSVIWLADCCADVAHAVGGKSRGLYDLMTLELRPDNFFSAVAGFRHNRTQGIDYHALAGHLPVAFAADMIAGGEEHAIFERPG